MRYSAFRSLIYPDDANAYARQEEYNEMLDRFLQDEDDRTSVFENWDWKSVQTPPFSAGDMATR